MGERYPPGTIVMTTAGPAEVLHKYKDGSRDYSLTLGTRHRRPPRLLLDP